MANNPANNNTDSHVKGVYSVGMFGRKEIYTDYSEITRDNLIEVLSEATNTFAANAGQSEYLWNYYKGAQPIQYKVKDTRPDINNCIVVNLAKYITDFSVGYLLGEPIQYINVGEADKDEEIQQLNAYMRSEGKPRRDTELGKWMHICGVGYRFTAPDEKRYVDYDEAPFELYTLKPTEAFVVRHSGIGHPVVLGVTVAKMQTRSTVYTCYTPTERFVVVDGIITEQDYHLLGRIPIIEYPLNDARMGCFEPVLGMLEAINMTESDRQDGIDSFVQSFMAFHNMDIDMSTYEEFLDKGLIMYKDVSPDMRGDLQYITSELNQDQTQTLVNHMTDMVLMICGVPSISNATTSDSSNNGAVILKNGWQGAEARAKSTEQIFKESEMEFLRLVLWICRTIRGMNSLRISDIEAHFTRRNYEDIQSKTQVLVTLLGSGKVAPKLAFEVCGLFIDPEEAYQMSLPYIERELAKEDTAQEETADAQDPVGEDDTGA